MNKILIFVAIVATFSCISTAPTPNADHHHDHDHHSPPPPPPPPPPPSPEGQGPQPHGNSKPENKSEGPFGGPGKEGSLSIGGQTSSSSSNGGNKNDDSLGILDLIVTHNGKQVAQ